MLATPEAPGDLHYINPNDLEGMFRVAVVIGKVADTLLDPATRANIVPWFIAQFGNPINTLFEIGKSDGFIGFQNTVPGWRTQVLIGAATKEGMRRQDAWVAAGRAVILAHEILSFDLLISPDNSFSKHAAESFGAICKGTIRLPPWYTGAGDGQVQELLWYEATKEKVMEVR